MASGVTTINGHLTYATTVPCTPPPASPMRLEPSPRGMDLQRLMRQRTRYLGLFHAADDARDAPAAAAWDLALMRLGADIRAAEDAILAAPIYSVANLVDRAIVAHGRGMAAAFVAGLVRGATQA